MIYFAQPIAGGPVKIGCSGDVPTRIRQLEAHYGQPLAVLATMDGDRATEREVHERFAHLRFGRTEQFRPAADLMAFIGRPLLVSANPDAVEELPTPGGRASLFNLKGSEAEFEYLARLAKALGMDKATTVRHALASVGQSLGLGPYPFPRPRGRPPGTSQ